LGCQKIICPVREILPRSEQFKLLGENSVSFYIPDVVVRAFAFFQGGIACIWKKYLAWLILNHLGSEFEMPQIASMKTIHTFHDLEYEEHIIDRSPLT